MRYGATLAVGAALIALAGCAGDPSVSVAGTVTFDGQPLEKGEIIFTAPDGSAAPAAAPIENGRYETRTRPGAKKVAINASRRSKTVDPLTREAEEYSFIPAAYNVQSKLTADIKPGDRNEVSFDLKSKP
ncbi:MAG: hypothetical protein J0I06_13660 [Planctomycetes bacterium]|nr:hypothetical protein [Planctomycetota bacterium]